MRNRDGLKLLDHTSFTEDVEGQIERRRLRLGAYGETVLKLLPAIERALADNGFTYEHCGLGGVASGQLSVVRHDGRLYRIGISARPKWDPEGTPPMLSIDDSWCGVDAGRGDTFRHIAMTQATTSDDIDALLAGAAACFAADRLDPRHGND